MAGCADTVNNPEAHLVAVICLLTDTPFAPGETSKTLIVPIIDDRGLKVTRLRVVLSNPVGATLGEPVAAIIAINDATPSTDQTFSTHPLCGWYLDTCRANPTQRGSMLG